jgi:hypothetical protein
VGLEEVEGGRAGGRRRKIAMNELDAERDRATPAWVDADELRFSPLSLHATVLGGRERQRNVDTSRSS